MGKAEAENEVWPKWAHFCLNSRQLNPEFNGNEGTVMWPNQELSCN